MRGGLYPCAVVNVFSFTMFYTSSLLEIEQLEDASSLTGYLACTCFHDGHACQTQSLEKAIWLNVTPTAGVTLLGGVRWLSVSSALCDCLSVLASFCLSSLVALRQGERQPSCWSYLIVLCWNRQLA